jgi:hypothetical protein
MGREVSSSQCRPAWEEAPWSLLLLHVSLHGRILLPYRMPLQQQNSLEKSLPWHQTQQQPMMLQNSSSQQEVIWCSRIFSQEPQLMLCCKQHQAAQAVQRAAHLPARVHS